MTKTSEHSATVSSKGQVVIPGDVRRRLGLVQGSVLRFVVDADGVRLLPAAGDVRRLKGRLPQPDAPVSVEDMNRAIAERRAYRPRLMLVALDTNVLVRYIAQDDARQSAAATKFIEQRLGPAGRGFVSLVALLETVWVMESRYGADAALVADILADLLDAASLEVQDSAAVRAALQRYRAGGVDLHDCLIVSLAEQRKARVVTFDARAAKRLGMELLR